MKTMTCKQLGGVCDKQFHADSFEEIAEQSKKHGMEMFQKEDKDHIEAYEQDERFDGKTRSNEAMVRRKKKKVRLPPQLINLLSS